ncbi:hypothetical protein M5362_13085 [Streptomyces sp. Je 1-79]|uniref:hypothetical protein n=1 Tax=Streptomyces sp. Je 1-79 TaxID=2943847 RepID=UPI0021A8016C|nr:hypothetical protein [Streptomyces sp. Je 1-79]MCT4354065.1 hypothetical protein [Streptomyces sp. Je 1-79]
MTSNLERGVGELKKFRNRVNTLLAELEGGDAGAATVGMERVTRGSFGVGIPFGEAEGFYSEFDRVHRALVGLSKSLSDQIELLSIGVHAADVGYDNVEEEQRRSFHEIQARLDKERDEAIEAEKRAKSNDPAQPAKPVGGGKTFKGIG